MQKFLNFTKASSNVSKKYQLLKFKACGDNKGWLISLESSKNIPFEIKRVFYIFSTQSDVVRGKHALKKGNQILISICGSCKVSVDDGENKEIFNLNNNKTGLLINNMVWREMFDFSDDCVLLVLSDHYYNEDDYINSYKEFLKALENDRNYQI